MTPLEKRAAEMIFAWRELREALMGKIATFDDAWPVAKVMVKIDETVEALQTELHAAGHVLRTHSPGQLALIREDDRPYRIPMIPEDPVDGTT